MKKKNKLNNNDTSRMFIYYLLYKKINYKKNYILFLNKDLEWILIDYNNDYNMLSLSANNYSIFVWIKQIKYNFIIINKEWKLSDF